MATASDSSTGGNTPPSSEQNSPVSSPAGTPGDTPNGSPVVNGDTSLDSGVIPPAKSQHQGPKFKLIHEGDIQLCRLNHTRTIVSKIMNSKYLRRWESHHIVLGDSEISSSTVSVLNFGS